VSVLTAEGICKSFGPQELFENITLALQPGERVGLLGRNGTGKSTLARILAGREEADAGSVLQQDATVFYLDQEPYFEPGQTIEEVVCDGLVEWQAARKRYDELTERLSSEGADEGLLQEQAAVEEEILVLGGWDPSHRARGVMHRLGIVDPSSLVDRLSGGELRRVALAQLLVARPRVAILDEPTNHLDVATIAWLENYLVNDYQGALLFITHDRYLLEALAHRILELDGGQLHSYRGGWSDYLEAKALREEHATRVEANRRRYLKTELEWLRRSPQARTTKQKARIKRIETVAAQEPVRTSSAASRLEIGSARAGKTICELHDLRAKPLLMGLTFIWCAVSAWASLGPMVPVRQLSCGLSWANILWQRGRWSSASRYALDTLPRLARISTMKLRSSKT
jgi:ATP-binding cassette subfamily F protein uup